MKMKALQFQIFTFHSFGNISSPFILLKGNTVILLGLCPHIAARGEDILVGLDLLQGSERASTLSTVRKCNPSGTFPTLLINDRCIVGFRENEIREALES